MKSKSTALVKNSPQADPFENLRPQHPVNEVAITYYGNNMYPRLLGGDTIVCRQVNNWSIIPWGNIFIIVTDEQRFVNRICKSDKEDHWRLVSDNREQINGREIYPAFELPISEVKELYCLVLNVRRTAM